MDNKNNNNHVFTKEEIDALILVQTRATEQMITIATTLRQIAEDEKEVLHKLSNGLRKEIIDGVKLEMAICNEKFSNELTQVHEMLNERGVTIKRIDDNINYTKWFIGIIGVVVVIATVILRGMDAMHNQRIFDADKITIQQLHGELHKTGLVEHILEETTK